MKNFTLFCLSLLLGMNLLTQNVDAANGDLQIYFLSDASGSRNLWRGDYSPSGLTNLAQLTFYDNHFIGTYDICKATDKVAFVLIPTGGHRGDIYIASMDLQNPQLIPNQPSEKAAAALSFSPDGNSIAFSLGASESTSNDLIVATINVDGTNYQQIISANQPRGIATHKNKVDWTEYGLYIGDTEQWSAYSTKFEIFHYDFQTFTNLTNTPSVGENNPILSPNGQSVAYQLRQTGSPNKYGIGVMNSDGSNQNNIIPLTSGIGFSPGDWLNDNTILYSSSVDGSNDIWQINSDGSNQIKLTNISGSSLTRPKISGSFSTMVSEIKSNNSINVYPNPSNGLFNFNLSESKYNNPVSLKVLALNGVTILDTEIKNETTQSIDLSSQPTGVYILRITDGSNIWFQKLIKQ